MRPLAVLAALLLTACGGSGVELAPAPGQPEPDAPFPAIELTEVARGFVQPTVITHAGDGSGRLFVAERGGAVRTVVDGAADPVPFLDLRDRVLSAGSEQGLLGLAFPPGFAAGGRYYVHYTGLDGSTVLSRIDAAGTETVLFTQPQPFANHNGGQLAFGPDGYLYVGLGDGGSAGDPQGNAQNLDSLLGKILRVDVEGDAAPYGIPPDNPFGNEIWAWGLRNPWRFAFDDAGGLFIADVGQSMFEEINFQPAASDGGQNYGWNIMEGTQCYASAVCDDDGLTLPVHEYSHALGCSVTGGDVSNGVYYFADFCSGRIWGLRRDDGAWQDELLLDSGLAVSTFGTDEAGALYLADYDGGVIYRIDEGS